MCHPHHSHAIPAIHIPSPSCESLLFIHLSAIHAPPHHSCTSLSFTHHPSCESACTACQDMPRMHPAYGHMHGMRWWVVHVIVPKEPFFSVHNLSSVWPFLASVEGLSCWD